MKTLEQRRWAQARLQPSKSDAPAHVRKPAKKLNLRQRSRAEVAFAHGLAVSRKFDAKYERLSLDFDGAVAEHIVKRIPTFRPGMSSLKTWSQRQAYFACLDLIRKNVMLGRNAPVGKQKLKPKTISIESAAEKRKFRQGWASSDPTPTFLTKDDPATPLESNDALAHLLRGLTRQERDIMILHYRDDMTMAEIGDRLGVSESRVSQVHTRVILHLRENRRESA